MIGGIIATAGFAGVALFTWWMIKNNVDTGG